MDGRGMNVIKAGVVGFLTLCIIMVSFSVNPVMGEEVDSVASLDEPAIITNITFTRQGKDDVVAVIADRPFVFSYYPLSDPPRAVFDLAQSDPGTYTEPLTYQGGQVKQLRVQKQKLESGQLTRLEFYLVEGADFQVMSYPENNQKFLITFSVPSKKSAVTTLTAAVGVPPHPQKYATPQGLPAVPPSSRPISPYLKKIIVTPEGIDLIIDAPVLTSSTFFMKKPNRMVVDLPGVLIALSNEKIPIHAFGIDHVRLGRHERKTRIVFEGGSDAVLRTRLIKTDTGLRLLPATPGTTATVP